MSDTAVVLICANCGIWINVDVRYASPECICSVFNELGESGSDHPGSEILAFVGFFCFFLKGKPSFRNQGWLYNTNGATRFYLCVNYCAQIENTSFLAGSPAADFPKIIR